MFYLAGESAQLHTWRNAQRWFAAAWFQRGPLMGMSHGGVRLVAVGSDAIVTGDTGIAATSPAQACSAPSALLRTLTGSAARLSEAVNGTLSGMAGSDPGTLNTVHAEPVFNNRKAQSHVGRSRHKQR